MLLKLSLALVLLLALNGTAVADSAHHDAPAGTGKLAGAEASLPLSDGEIKKVDKDTGKLTIKHSPITNLGMPAMTMVFRVNDPALLDKVKNGDKIRFAADKVGGVLTVMRVEPASAAVGNSQAD